jgi:hypothetical protein
LITAGSVWSTALCLATYGNDATQNGRNVFPKWLCRVDFHLSVPATTGLLGIYNFQKVVREPYGGYGTGILAFGWTCFAILVAVAMATIWKRDPSLLPPHHDLKEELAKEMDTHDETKHVDDVEADGA